MSGPRISTGSDSKQDYGTPADFLRAVERRFGPIVVDLAAHAGNHKHARYFAPPEFTRKVDLGKVKGNASFGEMLSELARQGADPVEAKNALEPVMAHWLAGDRIGDVTVTVPNRDPNAAAFDAFKEDWRAATAGGIGWLNCEFSDVDPWAKKSGQGGNVTLLTPASVGTVWARTHVFGRADVYLLAQRLCFDGKAPFPKDCMLSHFHEHATGRLCVWDWRSDELLHDWVATGLAARRSNPDQWSLLR